MYYNIFIPKQHTIFVPQTFCVKGVILHGAVNNKLSNGTNICTHLYTNVPVAIIFSNMFSNKTCRSPNENK